MHFLKYSRSTWAVPFADPATAGGCAFIVISRHFLASSALGGAEFVCPRAATATNTRTMLATKNVVVFSMDCSVSQRAFAPDACEFSAGAPLPRCRVPCGV